MLYSSIVTARAFKTICVVVGALCLQAPAGAQVLDSVPKPTLSVLDDMNVDLRSGLMAKVMGNLSIGRPDSPALDYNIFSTSFIYSGRTPLYGTREPMCISAGGMPGCIYSATRWRLSGETEVQHSSPPSQTAPAGFTEQGSLVVLPQDLARRDGSIWRFGDGGGALLQPYGLSGVLSSITYPNGEVLTYNWSGGQLRSVVSSTGYMLHLQNFVPYLGSIPSKVTLINLNQDYCAPLATSCTGLTLNWPSVTYTATNSGGTLQTTAMDNVGRVTTRSMTNGATVAKTGYHEWTATFRYVTPEGRWQEHQRLNKVTSSASPDGVPCSAVSVPNWVRTLAGEWNYSGGPSSAPPCHPTSGPLNVVSTGPDGLVQKWESGGFVDALNRKTSYQIAGYQNGYFGDGEMGVSSITQPEGNKVDFTYDDRGNLTESIATAKTGGVTMSSRGFYGPNSGCTDATVRTCNLPQYTVDANGNRTDYTYYSHGGIETKTLPADQDGVRGKVSYAYQPLSARYKNASGVLISGSPIWKLTEAKTCKEGATCAGSDNEIITTYSYNDNLLPSTETVSTGTGTILSVVTTTFDALGNITAVDGPVPGDVDKVHAFFDDARQKLGDIGIDPDGAGPLRRPASRTTYNLDGQIKRVESGTTNGTTLAALNAMIVERYVDTAYDDLGRAIRETTVAGGATQSVMQFSHDIRGRVSCTAVRMNPGAYSSLPSDACALGPAGAYGPDRITKKVYTATGHLAQVVQAHGTADRRAYATYGYSDNGFPLQSIDANGNRTRLTYDGFDRLSSVYYPSPTRALGFDSSTPATALATAGNYNPGDYESFTYFDGGQRKTWRRRDTKQFVYQYDGLNREIFKNIPDTYEDVYTGYDLLGNVRFKRFGSISGPGVSYGYDGLSRLESSTDMNGRIIGYRYNEAAGRKRLTFPDNNYIGYTLDGADRMTAFGWNADSGLFSQTYDSLGQLVSMTKGGGITSIGYHTPGRVASIQHNLSGTAHDITWSFATYNPAGQLVSQGTSSNAYDYEQLSTTGKAYDGLNRDATIAGLAGGYDARGNLTYDGTRTFTYDVENRLLTATGGAANLTLTYDPEGRIVRYQSGSQVTTFLYDGASLIAEYDGSGALLRRYVHGSKVDNPVVWLEGSGVNDTRYFYTNYQGSVIAQAGAAGNLLALYKYGPFGEPRDASNNEGWSGARFRYTGQLMLPEAKLYYYKSRVYDPDLGRFLQTDPIGSEDDLNLYAYVGNDPMNGTDPTGAYLCGTSHECLRLAQGLERAQEAVEKMRKGSAEQKNLKAVLEFMGKEGQDNGVHVSFSPDVLLGGASMAEDGTINIKLAAGFSTAGQGYAGDQATSRAGVIVHEGQHGRDLRALGRNNKHSRESIATERRASELQSQLHKAMNHESGINPGLWSTAEGYSEAERKAAVEYWARSSTARWCGRQADPAAAGCP